MKRTEGEVLHEVRAKVFAELERATSHRETEGMQLLFGDQAEYKRGGIEALKGVLAVLDEAIGKFK